MCRRVARAVGVAVAMLASVGAAQDAGDAAIETYLSDHGLNELLALHLQQQLERGSGPERLEVAERLGALYAMLLEQSRTVESRRLWEDRSRELLRSVPEAETHELRLNLAKVRYLAVEGVAERWRLGLATPEERAEAERVLEDVRPLFVEMGRDLHRRVENLEAQESRGHVEDWKGLERALAEARRLRSLAMYYAGWSEYYLALLSGKPSLAEQGLVHFGWLLNASAGRDPELERLPRNMLRFEHVARAAIGTALCLSLQDEDEDAMRWLDAVEESPDVSRDVKSQLFARRLAVLASARRWADMRRLVELRRGVTVESPERGLTVAEARLLAVLTLEALEDERLRPDARTLVRSLAEVGLEDLVNQGEVGHVLSLVKRYGTAPIGDRGFIVLYVRGLQAYDQARTAHEATGEDTAEPTGVPAVANRYREAAEALLAAIGSEDAGSFAEERSNAGLMAGYALFYADRPVDAADLLESSYRSAPEAGKAEDALWLAVVALDRAVLAGAESQRERLAQLATVFIERYPTGDRAARLLMIKTAEGLIDDERAVGILLDVRRDAPIYGAARRQAARLLYRMFRRAPSVDRDFAALRFIEIGEEVLDLERRAITESSGDEEAMEAGQRAIALSRQLLDAMLALSAPDVSRTEHVFDTLSDVTTKLGIDTSDLGAEIAFRRLQVALARGEEDEAERWLTELHAQGGRYSDAADRLLYRQAYDRWVRAPHDAALAVEVVRHGLNLLTQFGTDDEALLDPVVYGLYDTVASAAATAWRLEQSPKMLDVALELDERLIGAGRRSPGVLTRFAELAEAAGRREDALESWRILLSGYEPESEDWFEARYQSIRLLAELDPARARVTMDQHTVLYPEYGPDPWGEQLRELDERIPRAPVEGAGGEEVGGP